MGRTQVDGLDLNEPCPECGHALEYHVIITHQDAEGRHVSRPIYLQRTCGKQPGIMGYPICGCDIHNVDSVWAREYRRRKQSLYRARRNYLELKSLAYDADVWYVDKPIY